MINAIKDFLGILDSIIFDFLNSFRSGFKTPVEIEKMINKIMYWLTQINKEQTLSFNEWLTNGNGYVDHEFISTIFMLIILFFCIKIIIRMFKIVINAFSYLFNGKESVYEKTNIDSLEFDNVVTEKGKKTFSKKRRNKSR